MGTHRLPDPAIHASKPAANNRIAWIDAARGVSVAAIVLFHVVLWDYTPLTANHDPYLDPLWQRQGEILGSVRIPMLLLLSGLLASSKIRSGFASPGALRSMAVNYYFYALWLMIYFAVFLVIGIQVPHAFTTAGAFFRELLIPGTTLWYIFALVVYTFVLTLLHRVPAWLMLTVLLVMTIGLPETLGLDGMWAKIIHNLVFFAIGVYLAPLLRGAHTWLRWWHGLPLAVVAAGSLWSSGKLPWEAAGNLLYLSFSLAAAALLLWGVILLCQIRMLRGFLTFIGTRTLSIYVLHAPLIYLLLFAEQKIWPSAIQDVAQNPMIMSIYPLVVTAAIIAVCLGLERITRNTVPFLFRAPRWLAGARNPERRS